MSLESAWDVVESSTVIEPVAVSMVAPDPMAEFRSIMIGVVTLPLAEIEKAFKESATPVMLVVWPLSATVMFRLLVSSSTSNDWLAQLVKVA